MQVLVIGRDSLIGYELCRALDEVGISCVAPDLALLDMTNKQQLQKFLTSHPQARFVVNTLSYRDREQAECEPLKCFALNRDAVADLADLCTANNKVLLHLSSYRVLDGVIFDQTLYQFLMSKQPSNSHFFIQGPNLSHTELGIKLSKRKAYLLDEFNLQLAKMQANGEIQQIINRYKSPTQ